MPGKRVSTNNRGTDIFSVVSGKAKQFKASIGKPTPPVLFIVTGGTESTPGDGYKYHVFNNGEAGTFEVVQGTANVEIMLQGAGGGGTNGVNSGGNAPGGAGGAGGATGIWNVNFLTVGTHSFAIGGAGSASAGAGGHTVFTTDDDDTLTSEGGSSSTAENLSVGFGGGTTAGLVANYTTTGQSGPVPNFPGGNGSPAGGYPQPTDVWWRPYISPGDGGSGGGHTQNGNIGSVYGGGGGGGGGSGDSDGAGSGAPGANGRAVVRYLLGQ